MFGFGKKEQKSYYEVLQEVNPSIKQLLYDIENRKITSLIPANKEFNKIKDFIIIHDSTKNSDIRDRILEIYRLVNQKVISNLDELHQQLVYLKDVIDKELKNREAN